MLKPRAQQLELPPRPRVFRRIKPEDRLTDPALEQCRDRHEDRPDHERPRLSEPNKKVIPKLPRMAVARRVRLRKLQQKERRGNPALRPLAVDFAKLAELLRKPQKNYS
jgi:hypothetical protein